MAQTFKTLEGASLTFYSESGNFVINIDGVKHSIANANAQSFMEDIGNACDILAHTPLTNEQVEAINNRGGVKTDKQPF